jgi:hypothetical protein
VGIVFALATPALFRAVFLTQLGATGLILTVHTLGAYIEDAQLRVPNTCDPVRTFHRRPVGGDDVVVCRPVRGMRS